MGFRRLRLCDLCPTCWLDSDLLCQWCDVKFDTSHLTPARFRKALCWVQSFSFHIQMMSRRSSTPRVGLEHPFPPSPLSFHFIFCSFITFPLFLFLIGFTYFLLLSIPSPFSTRVVPLRFQAGGRRRRPNLGLVCCVYFMLSGLFSS